MERLVLERVQGRFAAVCPKCESDGHPRREFLASQVAAVGWRCPEHGVGVVQVNVPYVRP